MKLVNAVASLYQRLSIRTKMLLFILLLTVFEFVVLFITVGTAYRNSNIDKGYADNVRILSNIRTEFFNDRLDINSLMINVHVDKAFYEALSQLADNPTLPRQDRSALINRVAVQLQSYMSTSKLIVQATVHINDGLGAKICATYSSNSAIATWQEIESKHLQTIVDHPGRIFVFSSSSGRDLIFSRAQPVKTSAGNTIKYCLSFVVNPTEISQILKRSLPDGSRQAVIFTGDGAIVNASSTEFYNYNAGGLGLNWSSSSARGICSNAFGKSLYTAEYIDSIGMYVGVMSALSAIDLTTQAFQNSVLAALASLIAIAIVAALLVTGWINRPLRELIDQFCSFDGQKKAAARIHVSGSKEIAAIADTANSMLDRQEALLRDNYIYQIQERNARIELLQVQINPHFVFNTLDIVNWFIFEHKNEQASEVLVALGKMLRYSTYKYQNFVPLREEIEQIRHYLFIQLCRYDNNFATQIDVEPGLEDMLIPCLIIQPLVENAVKYGVPAMTGDGIVSVSIHRVGNDVSIVVRDNGKGMTREQIDNLFTSVRSDSQRAGIGVANVNERIRLLFGDAYRVQIESEPGQYTQVTIALPYGRNEGI